MIPEPDAPWIQLIPPEESPERLWTVRSDQGTFLADDLSDALHSAADAYERSGDLETAAMIREDR